ncbi:MAG TPA: HD domain-containing protein [bacterium]|nr:HD domain-containing protein [bacterium]
MPAKQPLRLHLSELIGALSHALDMTEGLPPGHSLRCCWLGMHIGIEAGMGISELQTLYYTLLLKDAGCSSNAARLFELYRCDDLIVKRDFKSVNSQSIMELGRFMIGHVGLGESLRERLKLMFDLTRQGDDIGEDLFRTRCERGADIALKLGFDEHVAHGVRCLDEHWNGQGKPAGIKTEAIPMQSRIALLAQVIEVFHAASGVEAALREVRARSGSWFDPALVSIVERLAVMPEWWAGLQHGGLMARVRDIEPQACAQLADEERLDAIAEAFAQIIDAKSPFTFGHSTRVAVFTDILAEAVGLDTTRRNWLRRGALLHDIGKLGVSNAVLDKPGKLTEKEWVVMRMHPVHTESILSKLPMFADLAEMSAAHHERLDGQGYPKGLRDQDICLETRLITLADIFDALTAQRPYREAMPIEQALSIMSLECGSAIDGDLFRHVQTFKAD